MWGKVIFGYQIYDIIIWFLTYSVLGWAIESIYMSFCNKKITNRGFAKGPICPIYGVGALTVYFVLRPYSDNYFLLFILGALFATTIEWITAKIMLMFFHEVWWDYKNKPFNYKGILCLESTIAWGIYTLFLFGALHNVVTGIASRIPYTVGHIILTIILIAFFIDFLYALYKEKDKDQD